MILFSLGLVSFAFALSFYLQKNGYLYTRVFTLLLGIAIFLACAGHSIVAWTADARAAFIPHIVGLFGIDTLLFLELTFLFYDMKTKRSRAILALSFFAAFELLDISFHIAKNSYIYISKLLYTTYELKNIFSHIFHYSYIVAIAIALLIFSIRWHKSKTLAREKKFTLRVIWANLLILVFDILNMAGVTVFDQSPNFPYCAAATIVFFIWYLQVKKHSSFALSVQNVSKEVFYTIDVPILIFDMAGNLDLYNAAAGWILKIDGKKKNTLRDLFALTDVDALRLLTKAKRSFSGRIESSVKMTNEKCAASYFVKLDYTGEPFCLIMTVSPCNRGE